MTVWVFILILLCAFIGWWNPDISKNCQIKTALYKIIHLQDIHINADWTTFGFMFTSNPAGEKEKKWFSLSGGIWASRVTRLKDFARQSSRALAAAAWGRRLLMSRGGSGGSGRPWLSMAAASCRPNSNRRPTWIRGKRQNKGKKCCNSNSPIDN